MPTEDGQYIRNVLYSENHEGGHTEDQALIIRRLFEQMECDYIVLDTAGAGIGIYDNLVKDLADDATGIEYPALQCLNDDEMADHYKGVSKNPRKVIYSIKANARWNSQCAFSLRDCLKRGKMRLLLTEFDYEDEMDENKTYASLSLDDKITLKMPYIQTSLLISELTNLEYTTTGSDVKIKETGTNRKDRYSSISYANQIANELERNLTKHNTSTIGVNLSMRTPSCMSIGGDRYGRTGYGRY